MEKEIKVLISACLLGDNVKYSGGNNLTPELVTLLEKYNVKIVKICPECFAGLPIPRVPSEILGDKVFSKDGRDIIENHKPPLQVVVCSMPKRQCYKLEAKALQLVCLSRIAPFSY